MKSVEELEKEIKKLKRKNLILEQTLHQDKNIRNKYIQTLDKLKKQDKELDELNKNLQIRIDDKTKELKELVERYDFAIKGSNDGLWDWNIKTGEVFYSKRWLEMLGLEENDVENSFDFWNSLIHEDDVKEFKKSLHNSLGGKITSFENRYRLKHKNDSYIWILNKGRCFFDEEKNPIRMSGFHTDITNIKNREKELKEKEALLAEQSRMAVMGEMLENIAHQWRQPLSTISTAATGMHLEKESGILTDEEFFSNLDTINETVQSLSKMIDDFKNFFISDKEKVLFETEFIIEKTIKMLHFDFDTINIIKTIENFKIYGSEVTLLQILMNLLTNARDEFKKSNSRKQYIFINVYKENDICIIEIIDNAGGINEDIMPKVFDPFFTTKEEFRATGIGLHMCKSFLENQFNGTIEVQNYEYSYEKSISKGAKFLIRIPL